VPRAQLAQLLIQNVRRERAAKAATAGDVAAAGADRSTDRPGPRGRWELRVPDLSLVQHRQPALIRFFALAAIGSATGAAERQGARGRLQTD
jgi:hypothetical protein